MRALVTGATGFVGRYLVKELLNSGDAVLGTYAAQAVPNSSDEQISNYQTLQLDIRDAAKASQIIRGFEPEVIYHLAGVAFVPQAEENFQEALLSNVLGTSNLIRQAHLLDKPISFLFVSSAEVYGAVEPDSIPISELTATKPQNNYSLSKLMAEQVVERYGRAGKAKAVIARPFNHIGAGQDPRFVASSFAEQLAVIANGKAPPLIKIGNLTAKRDFSDVHDIVRAYRLMVVGGHSGIFNLGSGIPTEVGTLLKMLIEISGLKVDLQVEESRYRKNEVPVLFADIAKAKRVLGWSPKIDLRQTLSELYKDCLARHRSLNV